MPAHSDCLARAGRRSRRLGRVARARTTVVLALLLGCAGTPAALAAGGASIAGAPVASPGVLQTGGGQVQEFWRVSLFASDHITVRSDSTSTLSVELYAPDVDDYTLRSHDPVNGSGNSAMKSGKSEFSFDSPFTGAGTIDICFTQFKDPCWYQRSRVQGAFSFTLAIVHKVDLQIAALPASVARGKRFRLAARVQSPAGMPAGECDFRPVGTRGSKAVGPVQVRNGVCSARVSSGLGRKARFKVTFTPADGWSAASAATRAIRVRKR
jgi:hypothetical protein